MTKVNKVVKHGIEDEVNSLLDGGSSVYTIRDIVRKNHHEEPELSNISHMAIQRHKEYRETNKLMEVDESGEDLIDFIKEEYKETNQIIRKELDKWSKRIDDLYKKAKEDGNYSDVSKVIQQATKTTMDKLKVSESKMFHLGKQIRTAGDINQKKVQNLNIIMIGIANRLCPECKKLILEELSKTL